MSQTTNLDHWGKSNNHYIYGIHPALEALKAGKDIEKILVQKSMHKQSISDLLKMANEQGVPVQFVPIEKLNKITLKNHQGVICQLSEATFHSVEQVVPQVFESSQIPFFIALDRITDVRNFGAIARTAECAGVQALIIPAKGAASVNADAVKTSAGALHRITVARAADFTKSMKYLQESGIQLIACSEKGKDIYYDVDMTIPVAIIMGSEEDGISPELLRMADHIVRIPLQGKISSLNVSVAAGIMMYEVLKQRIKL